MNALDGWKAKSLSSDSRGLESDLPTPPAPSSELQASSMAILLSDGQPNGGISDKQATNSKAESAIQAGWITWAFEPFGTHGHVL